MKNLALTLIAVAALVASSCTRETAGPDPNALQEVIFTGANPGAGSLKSEGDGYNCDNAEADYALVTIEGVTYYPATFYVNGVLYTQAIKLAPGDYDLQEFILMNNAGTPNDDADDFIVNAAPHADSPFGDIVSRPLDFTFNVQAFTKSEIVVEVVCYEEAKHQDFGFVWFRVNETRMRQIFFFGDFCDEYFEDYAGTFYGDYPKVDMPAIFEIELWKDLDLDGVYETLIGTYNNLAGYVPATATTDASVLPLALPYLDRTWTEDRYELKVSIYQMVGVDPVTMEQVFDFEHYTNWYFSDNGAILYTTPGYLTDPAETPSFDDGTDGVYDFVVGFCTFVENDVVIPDPDYPTLEGCETAFAYSEDLGTCFLQLGFHRWGWNINLTGFSGDQFVTPIYAAAGQCDITKGTWVGNLTVDFNDDNTLTITYDMLPGTGNTIKETHLYVGSDILPKKGTRYTVAPGQFGLMHENLVNATSDSYTVTKPAGNLYIVAHAVVCGD